MNTVIALTLALCMQPDDAAGSSVPREVRERYDAVRRKRPPPLASSPARPANPADVPRTVQGVVERVSDGRVLVGTEATPEQIAFLLTIHYRRVDRKEAIAPRTIFESRVYQAYRLAGPRPRDVQALVGRSAKVTLEKTHRHQLVATRLEAL